MWLSNGDLVAAKALWLQLFCPPFFTVSYHTNDTENEGVVKRKEREKILTLPSSYVNFIAQQKHQKIIHNIVMIYQLGMFSSAEIKD